MTSLRAFGLFDLLDVALVSVLLYGVYLMVSKTRAVRILAGFGALGIMYLVGRYLDLHLTVAILQALFAVIIIALIVIFQDETRRLFERIGNLRWFSKRGYWGTADITNIERRIQILVDTSSDLAQQRIGALIVIEGDDDIGLLLSGGIELNGILSESIIRSIFDSHSQGHDGAIESRRIRFLGSPVTCRFQLNHRSWRALGHDMPLDLASQNGAMPSVLLYPRNEAQ